MWVAFIIFIAGYATLAGFVLPKIFFKVRTNIRNSLDRGVRNYKERNGRSIVYQPRAQYIKYMSQYIISERNEKKSILCKLNANITYLDYDIALFNLDNKIFNVINVKDNIFKPGFSSVIELPEKTMYACIIINKVNDVFPKETGKEKTYCRKPVLYASILLVLSFLMVLCVNLCIANIFGGVFAEFLTTSPESFINILSVVFVFWVINIIFSAIYIKVRNIRRAGRIIK